MSKVAIINGPNLNLVGKRETTIYGNQDMDSYIESLKQKNNIIHISYFQSNVEGEIINYIQSCMGKIDGIILNAGGYTHTSIAIADAIAACQIPTIEVHISNIFSREEYRKTSFIASKCLGSISGLGLMSYELALAYFEKNMLL